MQYFDILLFAVITGLLLIRLHRVLGRRTGHESPPSEPLAGPESSSAAEAQLNPDAEPEQERSEADPAPADDRRAAAKGLAGLQAADPSFDPDQFLAGAKHAFKMIVSAFAAGERKPLRSLLSDPVYRSFEASIEARQQERNVMEVRDIRVVHASIEDAYLEGTQAVVRVEFETEKIEVIRDSDGVVVDGDPDIPARANDLWTFSREVTSEDPNWILIRTGE